MTRLTCIRTFNSNLTRTFTRTFTRTCNLTTALPLSSFIVLLSLPLMLSVFYTPTAQSQGFEKYREHTEFDDYFRKYSKRFFGVGFDWHYFKAQAIAESNLNPNAESAVGAKGIMQLMPRTFEEVSGKSSYIDGALMEPRWNIAAGIWYNKYQFDYWQKGRALDERLKFMYGSYNTGRVNLRKAQREAINQGLNPRQWQSMHQALPAVTGRHSRETLNYVERIFEIKEAIK
ncbi:MAG: transglycosylase SLT domain-containing protein [Congregibacter sp.]